MKYLLDTCVISELVARRPEIAVTEWLDSIDETLLYLSVITIGEIQKGIAKLPDISRRRELEVWLNEQLPARFSGRIIPIDVGVMLTWGRMTAAMESEVRAMPIVDSFIAAIARHGDLCLVTRNEDDFKNAGLSLFNPWKQR